MRIFFVTKDFTELADASGFLGKIRIELLKFDFVEETKDPADADVLFIHEEYSFKNFNHIKTLRNDRFLSKYLSKLYTINFDDSATGLLKGLYSQIPKSRFNPKLHVAVPNGFYFVNDLVNAGVSNNIQPEYLASWRGNKYSNKIRSKIFEVLGSKPDCKIEHTDSWWNHSLDEKKNYIDLIESGKFSLCPAGWTPSTFRIFESMALGRCPVIIADNFVPPSGPDWNAFALFFPEKNIKNLYQFLVERESISLELGLKAKQAYIKYFGIDILPKYYADSLVELFQRSPASTNEAEIRRWKSISFQWSNSWTILQRILNKIKKLRPARTPEDDPER